MVNVEPARLLKTEPSIITTSSVPVQTPVPVRLIVPASSSGIWLLLMLNVPWMSTVPER